MNSGIRTTGSLDGTHGSEPNNARAMTSAALLSWVPAMYFKAGLKPGKNKWEIEAGRKDGGYPC